MACVMWSGDPRRSRASPSGPCGLFHQALALAGAGEVRQDIDAVRRQVAGGQHVLPAGLRRQAAQVAKPADARYSQRRMADCWPGSRRQGCGRTRGRAVRGYLLAVTRTREAGRRSGPDTVRARGGAGGRGRGAPGMSCCGLRVIPWTGPRQTCRTARRTPGSGRPANQSRDEAFGRPGGRRRQSPGPAAGADISSGGSRHAGAPTSRTAKR
jgi:hypothetical protein